MSTFMWFMALILWCLFAFKIMIYRDQTTPWHMTHRGYVSDGNLVFTGTVAIFATIIATGVIK